MADILVFCFLVLLGAGEAEVLPVDQTSCLIGL